MAKARLDIHQHVTDTIIAQIEAGTPPWRKPWTGGTVGACLPVRHNGEGYRGINVLMLWAAASERGYSSERWMTFNQAQKLGGTVKEGEKCARSVFYGTFEKKDGEQRDGGNEGEGKARIAFAKANNVFNADQIEGLPAEYCIQPDPARDLGTQADPALEAFFASIGVDIVTTDNPRAYYRPATDQVHMPPVATFTNAARYYGVLAHEITHWTRAEKRLDRLKKFGTKSAYAQEELVAEIGACFLAVHLGVEPEFDQSAAYIEGWLAALKSDKGLIFKAAAEAQKAVDFVLAAADANTIAEDGRAAA
ncbi:Antirestriction protein ArdC [Loktanella salsilacus]|uniref:Antirestriction protein ArdC n=1 Tax=Loktanella salsilacus TaxID=195913 RepID=A0A1I4ILU4_9RHOB|nr:zincin-like metallopeptidase domain-containing protein [Loktanella salsilacus]SFL55047.1 Antirestriction protein ArdC [Loktanella salsilacus]